MCTVILPACIMCTACMHCLMKAEEDVKSGSGVTDSC